MNLSRRLFLGRATSGSAVALAASLPALADTVQIEENPALLELAPLCHQINAECTRIDAERLAARARYEAIAPEVPACMVLSDRFKLCRQFVWCGEPEKDCEGKRIYQADGHSHRLIAHIYNLENQFPWLKDKPHKDETALTIEIRNIHAHAKRYEADVEHAKQVSGLEAVLYDAAGSFASASRYASRVAPLEARTWIGVAIKARAFDLAARWHWDGPYGGSTYYAAGGSNGLMHDVLRIAKGGTL